MAWICGADKKNPNCDISLSDGRYTVGLMFGNSAGMRSPTAIRRTPYPRMSTKIATTDNKYSDLQPPYYASMQDSWIGGRAGLNFEDDTTRYMDSYRAWTDQEKKICCGPQETYCSDFTSASSRQVFQAMPGDIASSGVMTRNDVEFTALIGDNQMLAHKFTIDPSVDMTTSKLAFIIKRVGTPAYRLHFDIYTDSGGSPGTVKQAAYLPVSSVTDNVSMIWEVSTTTTLTHNTSYWAVIHEENTSGTTENHWEVGTNPDAATNTKRSNGVAWSNALQELYFRLYDDNEYEWRFFEYKRAMYAAIMNDSGNPSIFLNGDRGAADYTASAGSLYDSSKAWTADEWIGCIVLITKGPGSSDKQPWRTITDSGTNTLTVSPDWDTNPTSSSEYVILGSNKWRWVQDLAGGGITDIAVADEMVYFTTGNLYVCRYNEYNNTTTGTWNRTYSMDLDTGSYGSKLCAIHSPDGWELWGSQQATDSYGTRVWKGRVPPAYSTTSDLYKLISNIDDGRGVWDDKVVSNVTVTSDSEGMKVTCYSGYSGSQVACAKSITPIDLTRGNKIGIMIKSSVDQHLGDLKLVYSDTELLERNYTPNKIWHYSVRIPPSDVIKHKAYNKPTSVYYHEHGAGDYKGWNSIPNLCDDETANQFTVTWPGTTDKDYLYVSSPERFDGMYVSMGTVKNAVTDSHLNIEFWDGLTWWTVYSITDGTIVGTHPADRTLGQSGLITWTMPDNWEMGCNLDSTDGQSTYLASDRYHLRIYPTKDLTVNMDIAKITVCGDGNSEYPDASQFVSYKNVYDSDYSTFNSGIQFYDNDSLYVRYGKRFDRIYVDLDTVNNQDSSMTVYYWNGTAWAQPSSPVDGTKSGSHTLAGDGTITFTMPNDWHPGCPTYLNEYLSETDYVVRLKFTVTEAQTSGEYLTDAVAFNKITLEDSSLDEVYKWNELLACKDGSTSTSDRLVWTNDGYVYVMHSSKYNKVYWTLDTLNAVDTTMTGQFWNGHAWQTLTSSDDSWSDGTAVGGYTLHKSGEMSYKIPYNWQIVTIGEETGYCVRFNPAVDLTQGIEVTELYVQKDDEVSNNIPALTAGRWTYIEQSITPNENPNPDESKIVSLGLYITHSGEQIIYIRSVDLISSALDKYTLGNSRVNSIEAYGDERMNPWIFTEDMIYEIQTQNDNAVVAMPLREIKALASEINGQAHTVSDVYLVFNLGEYIQKYYQHNLDDIGPNRDEGLPSNRQGDPVSMISYPGRLFLAIDAKTTGYSTIMLRRSSGWHEVYRAPYGVSVNDIAIQVIPNLSTRLWVSQGSDIVWLPLPTGTWDPKNDSNFRYTHESVLITGWITLGFLDISKFYKSVKLYSENLDGLNQYVRLDYQLEDGELESEWTEVSDEFSTSPFQELLLSNNYDVAGRRIRFRFRLITNDSAKSPVIKATILESILRFPIKYQYTCPVVLEDHKENYISKDMTARVEMDTDLLEEWADGDTVLKFRCNYSPYDDKWVVLEPLESKPVPPFSTNEQYEKHTATLTLLEV